VRAPGGRSNAEVRVRSHASAQLADPALRCAQLPHFASARPALLREADRPFAPRAAGVHVQDVVQAAMWSSLAVIGWLSLRLPSGALLFWLTSSCCVLGWVRGPPRPAPVPCTETSTAAEPTSPCSNKGAWFFKVPQESTW